MAAVGAGGGPEPGLDRVVETVLHSLLGDGSDVSVYVDPLPQALILTAIVIGFATTALFLVVLLAARGLTDNDHVDGLDSTEVDD